MRHKNFISAASLIFSLIALLHLLRISYGWEATIGGWAVPRLLSWIALVAAGYLAYSGFRLLRRM